VRKKESWKEEEKSDRKRRFELTRRKSRWGKEGDKKKLGERDASLGIKFPSTAYRAQPLRGIVA